MKNPKIFTVFNNGAKMEYDVILTFKSEVTGKDYVVYTDNSYDEKNKLRIYAAIYNPLTNEYIGPVEEKKEWIEIGKLLDKVILKKNKRNSGNLKKSRVLNIYYKKINRHLTSKQMFDTMSAIKLLIGDDVNE